MASMINRLFELCQAGLDTKGAAPGQSVIAAAEGAEGETIDTEVYQAPGVLAVPGDGAKGVWLPIGGSTRYGVVIALHNYALTIAIEQGETAIYSSNAAGDEVKALIKLKADGTIELNGNSKRFVTWDELNTALQAHTHGAGALITGPTPGSPVTGSTGAPIGLDLTAAKTTTLKTGGWNGSNRRRAKTLLNRKRG